MLNQERVCEMTKLAIFDGKEGRECKPMIQYFRKDYIGKELLKSFITGTIVFYGRSVRSDQHHRYSADGSPHWRVLWRVHGSIFCRNVYHIPYKVYKRTPGSQKILSASEKS